MVTKQRNWGVDRARLFAMFCVVLIHNNLQGGALKFDLLSFQSLIFALIENCGIIAVNLFAIISGYLMCDSRVNLSKAISLWVEAIIWSGFVGVLLYLNGSLGKMELLKSFFPVSNGFYWYLNAYFLMLPLLPILNAGLSKIDRRDIANLSMLLCLMGSLASFPGWSNGTRIEAGYSTIWLVVLYIIGAAIKKNETSIKEVVSKWRVLLLAAICPLLPLLLQKVYIEFGISPWSLINYNTPIVLAQSILVFLTFLFFDGGTKYPKQLKNLSSAAFTVYILDASWFFSKVLPGRFSWVADIGGVWGAILLILISFIIFCIFLGAGLFTVKAKALVNSKGMGVFCWRGKIRPPQS